MHPSAKRAARVAGGRRATGADRTSAKGATMCTRATQSTRATRRRRLLSRFRRMCMNNCALYSIIRSVAHVGGYRRHSAIRPSAPPLASSHGSAAVVPPNGFALRSAPSWSEAGGAVAKATVCTPSRW